MFGSPSSWRRRFSGVGCTLAVLAVLACAHSAGAAVLIADFENGTTSGFGALTSGSGVQPWSAPVSGQVIDGTIGSFSGSKVLQLSGDAAFNFGQSGGSALGLNLLAANLRQAFLDHNTLEFDWMAPPIGSTSGYNELFNIVLNSQGGGFATVAGHSVGTPNAQQFYFDGYNGTVRHVVVDYTNYKNTVLASANPDAGGWLELGITPNAGGYSGGLTTAQFQFDNFAFTPEPSGLALVAVGVAAALRRRRRTA